jgi:hypothetical protein
MSNAGRSMCAESMCADDPVLFSQVFRWPAHTSVNSLSRSDLSFFRITVYYGIVYYGPLNVVYYERPQCRHGAQSSVAERVDAADTKKL